MVGQIFWCANKDCRYKSPQPIKRCKQKLNGCSLCEDCYNIGLRLKIDVVVYYEVQPLNKYQENLKYMRNKLKKEGIEYHPDTH